MTTHVSDKHNGPRSIQSIPSLRRATLIDLVHGLCHGRFTSEDLIRASFARVEEVNHEFHAIIELNPHVENDAQLLDLEYWTRGPRGPLHGVLILLKDNIPTLDGTETTCCSLALEGAKPPKEAAVVTAVRDAGAILLGKANMAEWSGFRSTSGYSGWSPRGGQSKGIFYPGMKASGGSGGFAIAVALGLCFAAIGTDASLVLKLFIESIPDGLLSQTCYSIVSLAERSGVIGFKPTRNLLPSEGIIHASERRDTVGVLARTVVDAVHVALEIAHQSQHRNAATKPNLVQDISQACLNLDLAGMRRGIPRHLNGIKTMHGAKYESFRIVLSVLKKAGATVVHDIVVTGADEYEDPTIEEKQFVLDTDMKFAINKYLSSLASNPNNITNLQDLIESTKSCPHEDYPNRNVVGIERAQATDPNNEVYLKMLASDAYFTGEGGIAGALTRHNCAVLLVSTLSPIL